ncbi:sugar ABC transporter permease [Halanaerocella petrolearia]
MKEKYESSIDSNKNTIPEKYKNIFNSKKFVVAFFLFPAVFFCLLYLFSPIPISTYYSLFQWDGMGEKIFNGLGNWMELATDEIFWLALGNNIKLIAFSIVVQIPIALLLAVMLTRGFKGADFLKTVYFIPLLMSAVAIAILWNYVFDPNFGVFNSFLKLLDLGPINWLGNPDIALYAVISAVSWRYIPFYMILFIAAIVGIPEDLYEASKIDGATEWEKFRYITLPLLKPTIINAAVLILVGSLKYFGIVFAMTGGGPNHASELMATYMYKNAFQNFRMGYGSTIAVALFVIAFVTSLLFMNATKDDIRN